MFNILIGLVNDEQFNSNSLFHLLGSVNNGHKMSLSKIVKQLGYTNISHFNSYTIISNRFILKFYFFTQAFIKHQKNIKIRETYTLTNY
jgi:hypothetical protein